MFKLFRLRTRNLLFLFGAAGFFCLFLLLRSAPSAFTFRQTGAAVGEAATPQTEKKETQIPTAASAAYRTVPVLMYHSVCYHPTAHSVYILSPAAFRADLTYLKAHGYKTVFLRDLLAFAAGTGMLPEKPVVLTFDDGFYNNLVNVLPLLHEAQACAEMNVVGAYTDKAAKEQYRSPDYSYLTWEEVRALQESGCVEIGSHTYDLHALSPRNGCAQMAGESDEAYTAALLADAAAMRKAMERERVDATLIFAYPFGARSKTTQTVLEKAGFTVFLTCDEKLNVVEKNRPLPPLGRFNRTSALSTEAFMAACGVR